MTNKKLNSFQFLKKTNVFDILFILTFIVCIAMSITMEQECLIYISPVVIFTILLKYISVTKSKANLLFVFALINLIIINLLTFYSFHDYFIPITLLTSFYLILYSFILKRYLKKSNLNKTLSVSVLIGCILVGYIIFSVVDLIIYHIPDHSIIYVFICATCLLVYAIIFARIYLNDNYNNTILILASGIASIFHIGLSPINEYFFYSKTFTVLILISHFLSVYLFMKFISETHPDQKLESTENYF